MISRRQVLQGGVAALAGTAPGLRALAALRAAPPVLGPGAGTTSPLRPIPDDLPVVQVGGFPFSPGFTGDPYPEPHRRFPEIHGGFLGDTSTGKPIETVDVAVVGAGMSGLTAAYLLRDRRPVVFDLNDRFGGVAQGEVSGGVHYSLGGAYVIAPDEGTFLQELYDELNVPDVIRIDQGDSLVEMNGMLPAGFWQGEGVTEGEESSFDRFAQLLQQMGGDDYPEIPLPGGAHDDYVKALDQKTFRQDIQDRMLFAPLTPLLSAAIQAYCYSSFGTSWEELSAASGWNFLAAEQFGRWVMPGGNLYLVHEMWKALQAQENPNRPRLLSRSSVFNAELVSNGVILRYINPRGQAKALRARQVVMAAPKFIVKHMMPQVEQIDPEKWAAWQALTYRAYIVANVVLEAPIETEFYDIFLLGDGYSYPMTQAAAAGDPRVVDVVNGRFSHGLGGTRDEALNSAPRQVLTLYWPLPWDDAALTLTQGKTSWEDYANRLAAQLPSILSLLDVPASAVRTIRMAHWGHAMPVAAPGFIADGHAEAGRRPLDDRIIFVNQDNWALPAVENCLLDAREFTELIR